MALPERCTLPSACVIWWLSLLRGERLKILDIAIVASVSDDNSGPGGMKTRQLRAWRNEANVLFQENKEKETLLFMAETELGVGYKAEVSSPDAGSSMSCYVLYLAHNHSNCVLP